MTSASKSPARRYTARLGVAMTIYLASLFAAKYLTSNDMVDGPLIWILAILPGLAVCGAFYAVGMFLVEQKDEFMRMLLVRQSLIATAFALSIATVWGFLENFELVPHVEAFWISVLWFAGLGIGALVNKLTIGTSGMHCP